MCVEQKTTHTIDTKRWNEKSEDFACLLFPCGWFAKALETKPTPRHFM